jgi:hypothetical protein
LSVAAIPQRQGNAVGQRLFAPDSTLPQEILVAIFTSANHCFLHRPAHLSLL